MSVGNEGSANRRLDCVPEIIALVQITISFSEL